MQDILEHPTGDWILILDFGSQYTQLIARRVRELGVFSKVVAWNNSEIKDQIRSDELKGIILSGGPLNVSSTDGPSVPDWVFESNLPVFGICYGMQSMVAHFGGTVVASNHREFGPASVDVIWDDSLLGTVYEQCKINGIFTEDLTESFPTQAFDVWMSHGDRVEELPTDWITVGSTTSTPIAAVQHSTRPLFGVQFHPEVTHTPQGQYMLEAFVMEACGCVPDWNSANIVETLVAQIKKQVGSDSVLLGLSGGVDSSVTAALLHKAIGDQLTCVFVNNGLLRLNEAEQVVETFQNQLHMKLIAVDACDRFWNALKGASDPEKKRKIIGQTFIEVFDKEADALGDVTWLAQGTIYPDVIESADSSTGQAHKIKSHHNVGGLPANMRLKLLEPLRALFKDEVRRLGLELGLSHEMLYRHPFPGPGLGVRIMGEVKPEYAQTLRFADDIFIQELRSAGLYHSISQAFAVFLPVNSVGVVGDARQYEPVIALRAVETHDFMTARCVRLPFDFLEKVSNRIVNEVKGVSRVVYDISSKPPATIEWE
ncbi:MAG: glutamine-hydrolyzing GMP synthase [Pseudomonadota bacterium]